MAITLQAVVAMAENRVIGREGRLPWHLPEDLKHFKKLTLGHPILMGRKTFDSIGRPLPRRRNIVLSRTWNAAPPGVDLIRHPDDLAALPGLDGPVFIIGGAEIYQLLLPRTDVIWLTRVHGPAQGDAFMPAFEPHFPIHTIVSRHEGFDVVKYTRAPQSSP